MIAGEKRGMMEEARRSEALAGRGRDMIETCRSGPWTTPAGRGAALMTAASSGRNKADRQETWTGGRETRGGTRKRSTQMMSSSSKITQASSSSRRGRRGITTAASVDRSQGTKVKLALLIERLVRGTLNPHPATQGRTHLQTLQQHTEPQSTLLQGIQGGWSGEGCLASPPPSPLPCMCRQMRTGDQCRVTIIWMLSLATWSIV